MLTDPVHDGATGKALIAAHQPDVIRRRLQAGVRQSYLREFVYGAIDGAVTTFAVVSGVAGAGLSSSVVIILGVANLVGDGFSMAAGNYLSTQAENQQRQRLRHMEEQHIDEFPDGEREEIRQIFRGYGLDGADLEQVVDAITSNRDRWVDMMLREEHGIGSTHPHALVAALTTFGAFLLVGLLPLLPILINLFREELLPAPYRLSTLMTGTAFFLDGAVKSRFVDEHWFRAGATTLVVGGLAAALAYGLGVALSGLAT
ncbi:MAG: VIT1/CCC1 transporter family protein [Planctomycetaceae bacterium]|nr:VIT1/CCC1 transporter family protein [Planctomycetaceae bacterium]